MALADVISTAQIPLWVPLLLSLPEPVLVTLQESDLGLLEPMLPVYSLNSYESWEFISSGWLPATVGIQPRSQGPG